MSSSQLINSKFINRLTTIEKNSLNNKNDNLNFSKYYISEDTRYVLNNDGSFKKDEFSNRVIEVFSTDNIVVGYVYVGNYNKNTNTIDFVETRSQNIGYIEITKDGVKKAYIKAASPISGNGALEEWVISDDFKTIKSKYMLNSGINDYKDRPVLWISNFKKLDI